MTTTQATAERVSVESQKLTLLPLIALVVGSMIGGGVFNLPSDMSRGASPGAILIGWMITGIGMLMLAFVYQGLAMRKPELNAGPYAYAKAGFGAFVGLQQRLGILAERLPGQRRLCGRHLFGPLLLLSRLRRRQQPSLDHRRIDLPVAHPRAGAERNQAGGLRQRRHDDRQAGADLPLRPGRDHRLPLGQVHFRLLGPRRRARPGARLGPRPGAQHDAGHPVGLHRHRGRQRLFRARGQAPDVGRATLIGFVGRARHLCAGLAAGDRHSEPAGTGGPQGSLDGRRVRAAGRPLGRGADQSSA